MGNSVDQATKVLHSSLQSYLQCPKCGCEQLNKNSTSFDCDQCNQSYPQLEFNNVAIPFVFEDVDAAIHAWCARINGFKKTIGEEIDHINDQLTDKNISKLTRGRLKSLLKLKKQYCQQITDHLKCFDQYTVEQYLYSGNKVAKNQGVDSYVNNIFRDWCWNNGENEELLESVSDVMKPDYCAGETLTLGSGASRFSYDFHQRYKSKHSVLLDINPVLLGCAAKIINGETITLNEFPLAPLEIQDFSVEQQCKIDDEKKHEFSFLLADALNAPLVKKTFDTVLTPWVIDIIPMDFRDFIPQVNRLLRVGGLWVNSGSLAFLHHKQQWNYCQDEVVDLLKKYGFDDIQVSRSKINYLNSPHSAHGRIENIFNFSAKKKFDSLPSKEFNYLPDWINNQNLSIPNQSELVAASSTHLLQAQVLSAIDGDRSIIKIAALLAKQYDMSEDSAVAAVRQILIDNS
ncbi:MAG: methyltransferase domain-containing protein [Gammaproteobacteria bacterium]